MTRAEMRRNSIYLSDDVQGNGEILYLICVMLLLCHFVLFTTKTMFELSLGISKFTNFLELGHLAAIFVVCVSYLIEIALKLVIEPKIGNSNEFLLIDQIIMVGNLKQTCFMICTLYYPFRLI